MLNLENVDLICVDCIDVERAAKDILHSKKNITFNSCKLLTDKQYYHSQFDVIQIDSITDIYMYSDFIINELYKYIQASHVLIVQYDGFVLNHTSWNNNFLNYDYIGAPWYKYDDRVGNGGFSLRSKVLMEFISIITNMYVNDRNRWSLCNMEDQYICFTLRQDLEKIGFKFAPKEHAMEFSTEFQPPYTNQFGWHGGECPIAIDDKL